MKMTICLALHVQRNMAEYMYLLIRQSSISSHVRRFAGGGKMILGSDSHTRYGALGTMAMGEGGGELVKQLLSQTYDINMPGVVAIYLKGQPRPGVGPQDVALAIIGKVFANGYVKNKVMEFVGPGVAGLCRFPYRYRCHDDGDYLSFLYLADR